MLSATLKGFSFLGALLCGVGMPATSTSAAVTILYVSTTGSNSNPCTLAQPCRSLQYVFNRTPVGGEVQVLDSGFYGNNAKINKSMTVVGNGHTISLGASIIIDEPNAVVALRRLSLAGGGTVQDGVKINSANSVHIEHALVQGFTNNGVWAENVNGSIHIANTIIRNNNNNAVAVSGSADTRLFVEASRFVRNNTGVHAFAGQVMIARSEISHNGSGVVTRVPVAITASVFARNSNGIFLSSGTAETTVESSMIRGSVSNGIHAPFSGATVRLSNATIVSNDVGINNNAALFTRQNNTVEGNTTDYQGSGTVNNITPF